MEAKAWAGIDVGKEFHWAYVVETSGRKLLSRRVENDEADMSKNDPTYQPFINAVHSGVSANLCEALVKIHDAGGEQGV